MSIWSKAKTFFLEALLTLVGVGAAGPVDMDPVVAEAASGDTFTKVTDVSQLNDGDVLIFAASSGAVMGEQSQSDTYRKAIEGAISNPGSLDTITSKEGWVEVEIKGNNDSGFTIADISTDTPSYFCLNSDGNNIHSTSSLASADTFKFSIKSGALWHAQNSSFSSRYLEYNTSNPRFACYKNSQQGFYIYEKVQQTVEVGEIVRVEVTTPPTKVDYYVGDTFSLDGLVLTGYDANGNSRIIRWDGEDKANVVFDIKDGETLDVDDKTYDSPAEFGIMWTKGDFYYIVPNTWNYSVSDRPEADSYTLIENISDIVIGSRVILGVVHQNVEKFAYGYAVSGKTRFDVEQETFDSNVDGVINIDPNADVKPLVFEVRVAGGDGTIALYNTSDEYYIDGSDNGSDLKTNSYLSEAVYFTVKATSSGYQLMGNNTDGRYIAMASAGEYFRNYSNGAAAQLYELNYDDPSEAAMNEAIELSRYVMESDTDGQCETKFYVARDAYINRMTNEGREWFQSETDAWARYLAWATYLGENIDTPTKVEAYRPFTSNNEDLSWIIAVSLLGVASVAGLTYYFIRRKKRA